MFKIYREYIKLKIISLLKDRVLHYAMEKDRYIQRQQKETERVFSYEKDWCVSKERFESTQRQQINWCIDQWRTNHHKEEEVREIISLIETL